VLAMANLFYRDVKYVLEVVIMIWMFATSIVYPIDRIHGRLGAVLQVNPMVPIIDAFRAAVLGRPQFEPASLALVALVSVATLVLVSIAFHRAEFTFAENI